jgi:hypothetical protein
MSIQAYDEDMVEAPGAEALASGALANLWASLGRVWPLWSGLTFVFALAAGFAGDKGGGGLGPSLAASLAVALATGVTIRLLLGRGLAAWKPDVGLAIYVGVVTLLGAGLSTAAAMVPLPAQGAPASAFQTWMTSAAPVLVACLPAIWAAERLTPWLIGRLLDNVEMSRGRSWRLMRGVALRFTMAAILLGAPVGILGMLVVMLTQTQGAVLSHLATSPISGLAALLGAAVAAEVYRARVVVAAS